MDYLILVFFALLAWILHILLLNIYLKHFKSTKTFTFRAVHSAEIFLTTFIVMSVYVAIISTEIPITAAITTVIATLLVLDGISILLGKKMHGVFDIYHFIVAYFAVSLSIILSFSI